MYAITSPYFLSATTSAAVLHDRTQEEDFNDLYHLFMAKVARLSLDPALSEVEEARLIKLFSKLNELKREEE